MMLERLFARIVKEDRWFGLDRVAIQALLQASGADTFCDGPHDWPAVLPRISLTTHPGYAVMAGAPVLAPAAAR
jgi:hypothetical protein